MTTFHQLLIVALAVVLAGFPLTMYLADRAGIPDYGTNPNQKPGWTILYILVLFPTSLAFVWLALIALFFVIGA